MAKKTKTATDVCIGSIVGFVLDSVDTGNNRGQIRPAMVVKVWTNQEGKPTETGAIQLQVFSDSDGRYNDQLPPVSWRSSVVYSEAKEPGTWHWLEGN